MPVLETVTKLMAYRCEHCPLCRYARANPETLASKAIQAHGRFCPFWRAREKVYGRQEAQAGVTEQV